LGGGGGEEGGEEEEEEEEEDEDDEPASRPRRSSAAPTRFAEVSDKIPTSYNHKELAKQLAKEERENARAERERARQAAREEAAAASNAGAARAPRGQKRGRSAGARASEDGSPVRPSPSALPEARVEFSDTAVCRARLQEFLKQVDREGMDPYIARLQKRQRKQRRYATSHRSTSLH